MAGTAEERLAEIERRIAAVEEPHGLMRFIEDNADLGLGARRDGRALRRGARHRPQPHRPARRGAPRIAEGARQGGGRGRGGADVGRSRGRSRASMSGAARPRRRRSNCSARWSRPTPPATAPTSPPRSPNTAGSTSRPGATRRRSASSTGCSTRARGSAAHLSTRERSRVPLNRREAMVGLADFEGALDGIDAVIAATPAEFRRDNFVLRLIKARSLGALGRGEEAAAALADAQTFMASDPLSLRGQREEPGRGLPPPEERPGGRGRCARECARTLRR